MKILNYWSDNFLFIEILRSNEAGIRMSVHCACGWVVGRIGLKPGFQG